MAILKYKAFQELYLFKAMAILKYKVFGSYFGFELWTF